MTIAAFANSSHACPVPPGDAQAVCQFILDTCDRSNFKYLELYYCSGYLSQMPAWLVASMFMGLISTLFFVLGFLASNFLTPNLTFLARLLNLGEKLSGLTLLAFANGAPDILSTWTAMNSDSTALAIGELLGSANFALTVVVGTMAIVRPFAVDYTSFVRDVTLFLTLVVLSLLFLVDGKIRLSESIAMCLLYATYILISFLSPDKLLAETRPKVHDQTSAETEATAVDTFEQNIESLETGQSFRLSLADSIKLAFRTCDLKHIANYYRGESGDEAVQTQQHTVPVPSHIVITPADDDTPQSPVSADDQLLLPTQLSRTSSVASATSISTILSAEPIEVSWRTKLIPNYGRLAMRNKPFESLFNILTLPLAFCINVAVPTPANSRKEFDLNVRFFHVQLLLTPLVVLQELSFQTLQLTGVLFAANIVLSALGHTFYRRLFPAFSALVGFVNVLNLITAAASEIVSILKNTGTIYGVDESVLGLTVLSMGNSIGDLITNSTLASLGLALTGLHACFGSPLLYILFGVGLSSLVVCIKTGSPVEFTVDNHLKMSSFSLVVILLIYISIVPLRNWRVDRFVGYVAVFFWIAVTLFNVYVIK
ncbi:hypothetical protein KL905_005148 [Ogataea polymorpha]|uniref:Sodium/calcium exchanger membrane region domain-containing protein n=1 Tax=Ogataea polymorpha TaxID=460523 RepID=A0A9P8SY96_9ASCO|nr:hypothetical protein KL935_005245 [Ogataea polymorpha]KAG7898438.1 hypothetical protein KL907_005198 [Ogataea polymorpha]KAG7905204.1 hypothetical protein KL906_005241 [Ogataea polymorpha]KAG7914864.1 hypothetical protein KL905_005148 [Ogataea polymorpha]KAH3659553.1 hypothetical protein OGATHE_005598 [Ogataea polymorpha]